jgi:hypothetical protein
MRFFWDMDGVLYDFDKKFSEVMPGVNIEDDDAWSWEQLHAICPDIYSSGDIMPGIIQVWNWTMLWGTNYILTAVPRRWPWPNVTKHKRDWAVKNLNIRPHRVLFGPYAEDKQHHCVARSDVLIDDRIRNIEQWQQKGGIGIHHTSPENTLKALQGLEYM